jgi:hypothetical protein
MQKGELLHMDIVIEIWKDPIEIMIALDLITIHAQFILVYQKLK